MMGHPSLGVQLLGLTVWVRTCLKIRDSRRRRGPRKFETVIMESDQFKNRLGLGARRRVAAFTVIVTVSRLGLNSRAVVSLLLKGLNLGAPANASESEAALPTLSRLCAGIRRWHSDGAADCSLSLTDQANISCESYTNHHSSQSGGQTAITRAKLSYTYMHTDHAAVTLRIPGGPAPTVRCQQRHASEQKCNTVFPPTHVSLSNFKSKPICMRF